MIDRQIDSNYINIEQLFKYNFIVPIYQRPYSWSLKEVECLLNDLYTNYIKYKGLNSDDKLQFNYYIGNIILHYNRHNLYDIVDGQQRIATLSIILLSLYYSLVNQNIDSNDGLILKIKELLWASENGKSLKDKRLITLTSTDDKVMNDLFDVAYTSPKDIKDFIFNLSSDLSFLDNIKNNFKESLSFLSSKFDDKSDEYISFTYFLLQHIYVITIINNQSEYDTFSIFESINSKGKKLDDIDLIKAKIFSTLNRDDYLEYATKWGKLIFATKDKLDNYLQIYLRANIKFSNNPLNSKTLKSFFDSLDDKLCLYFNSDKLDCAYKKMIDDLYDNLDCYKALFDIESGYNLVCDSKFRFYYYAFIKSKFELQYPLFYKCFVALKNSKISKEAFIDIVVSVIKLSISLSTILKYDSKTMYSLFDEIFKNYSKNGLNNITVFKILRNKTKLLKINDISIYNALDNLEVYLSNRYLAQFMLSAYESRYKIGSNLKISFDESYSKLSSFGNNASLSLDHILVRGPNVNDPILKYYKDNNNKLVLKDGHDFPSNVVYTGMDYKEFEKRVLHLVGNLKIIGRDVNSDRSNNVDISFSTYKALKNRNDLISHFTVDELLKL